MNNFISLIGANQQLLLDLVLIVFAIVRIFLEFLPLNLTDLPLSRALKRHLMPGTIENFHRFGLVMASGYLFFALPYLALKLVYLN